IITAKSTKRSAGKCPGRDSVIHQLSNLFFAFVPSARCALVALLLACSPASRPSATEYLRKLGCPGLVVLAPAALFQEIDHHLVAVHSNKLATAVGKTSRREQQEKLRQVQTLHGTLHGQRGS